MKHFNENLRLSLSGIGIERPSIIVLFFTGDRVTCHLQSNGRNINCPNQQVLIEVVNSAISTHFDNADASVLPSGRFSFSDSVKTRAIRLKSFLDNVNRNITPVAIAAVNQNDDNLTLQVKVNGPYMGNVKSYLTPKLKALIKLQAERNLLMYNVDFLSGGDGIIFVR